MVDRTAFMKGLSILAGRKEPFFQNSVDDAAMRSLISRIHGEIEKGSESSILPDELAERFLQSARRMDLGYPKAREYIDVLSEACFGPVLLNSVKNRLNFHASNYHFL